MSPRFAQRVRPLAGLLSSLVLALAWPGDVFADEPTPRDGDPATPLETAAATEAPPAEPQPLTDLLTYATAARLGILEDPTLAAAYLAFWYGLTAEPAATQPEDPVVLARALAEATARQAASRRVPRGGQALGSGIAAVVATLAEGAGPSAGPPESFLGVLDRDLAPRLLVNGRYEFAGRLATPDGFDLAAQVWLRCQAQPGCAEAHDSLFAEALGGSALGATFTQRLAADARLQALPELGTWLGRAATLDQQLRQGGDRQGLAAAAAEGLWRDVASLVATASGAGLGPVDPMELEALLTLGRGAAWLGEARPMARAFGLLGTPLLEYSRLGAAGLAIGSFAGATAGLGLLFAGAHALAQFDAGAAGARPPRELQRLVTELHAASYRDFVALRSDIVLGSNAIDARLVRLGLTLDGVRDDVGRIESAQRERLRSDYLLQEARRWSSFEEENDRCFSLRGRDPASGRLRTADFRRCEDRFLQGAVRRSQYATRARDFVLDPTFLDPADLRFPFHRHYPLLLTLGGMDSRSALALVDPFDWQQHAAALLRLYQDHPAAPADRARRREALMELRTAGRRTYDALAGLALGSRYASRPVFRAELHEQLLDSYLSTLANLASRVAALDDPEADRFGERVTGGLAQPLPSGRRLAAIEATLAGSARGLAICRDAQAGEFLAGEQALLAEGRRFFGTPVSAEEIGEAWNRDAIAALALPLDDRAALVPPAVLWASLNGLGEVDICLARLRPGLAVFTRDDSPLRGHFQGQTEIDARLEVRFRPGAALRQAAGGPESPVLVAAYEATRACSFGYRSDGGGCSRGRCLGQLAASFWSTPAGDDVNGGRCTSPPLPQQLAASGQVETPEFPELLHTALVRLHAEARASQRERLSADVRRSNEFLAASASYLQYFAFAASTLATWPDPAEPLAPLFTAQDPFAPGQVVHALVEDARPAAEVLATLQAHKAEVLAAVNRRGAELAAPGSLERLPQLQAIGEVLERIELALLAHQ